MPEFFDVVLNQRACRQFRDDDVPDEVVERVLTAATHAPSAENRQPWVFVVDRKSTRLNSSHANISYAVFCLKKKKTTFALAASSRYTADSHPNPCARRIRLAAADLPLHRPLPLRSPSRPAPAPLAITRPRPA